MRYPQLEMGIPKLLFNLLGKYLKYNLLQNASKAQSPQRSFTGSTNEQRTLHCTPLLTLHYLKLSKNKIQISRLLMEKLLLLILSWKSRACHVHVSGAA